MRVGQTNSNPTSAPANTEVTRGRAATKPDSANRTARGTAIDYAGATDDVRADLSTRGKEFAAAKTAAQNTPDVREEKIAELKRRIEAGSYKMDPHAVADKMVDEHLKTSDLG